MYRLFQHLLFISLNPYCKKVHVQYDEYMIMYHVYNISPFVTRHNVFDHHKLMLRYPSTLHMHRDVSV